MNYKTIAKFIKDRRNLIIWDEPGLQWISDGIAVYPVFGMPKMNETEMIVFLGLEKDKDKISVRRRPVSPDIPLGDMDTEDDIMNNQGFPIIYLGELCRTYFTEQGVIAVYNKYINVIEKDSADSKLVSLYFRVKNGQPYVAIMNGLELWGLVLTCTTFGDERSEQGYQKIADGLKLARLNFGKKGGAKEIED